MAPGTVSRSGLEEAAIRRTNGWAAAGILALILASCGGSTDATSSQPATSAVTTTTTPPEPTTTATSATVRSRGLEGIRIAPEDKNCGYSRAPFSTYNRAAVIAAHDRSFYLGRAVGDGSGFDVEHVVGAKEAYESGLPRSQWATFGGDSNNLVMAVAGLNRSKSDRDIAEWGAGSSKWPTADIPPGRWCAYVTLTRDIKAAYDLTMDQAEARVMTEWLEYCGEGGSGGSADPATITSSRATTTTTAPAEASCTHWHTGNPKHTHPGTNHDGTHQSGKCAGY